MSPQDLKDIYELKESDRMLEAAARMVDSPCVTWPEGLRGSYPEDLVRLVEALLSRHRSRAGLKEVLTSGVIIEEDLMGSTWPGQEDPIMDDLRVRGRN